ncbi:MAG: hypothetical protein HND48_09895 [Chloroflexi bacterium]|nr:hypothetical protein [Chloroflexota bacterium]
MVLATIYFRLEIRQLSSRLHRIAADYLAFNNERFAGMLVVQLFGLQKKSIEQFDDLEPRTPGHTHAAARDVYALFVVQYGDVVDRAVPCSRRGWSVSRTDGPRLVFCWR